MRLLIIVVLVMLVGGIVYWTYSSKPAGEQAVVKQDSSATKGNFSQKGNVSIQEDGSLWLVWDEPGRMALNVKLKINNGSSCILGGQKKDCGLLSKSQENYYVNVEGEKSGDEVIVTKLEESTPPQ